MAIAKKLKTKDGYYLKISEEIWKDISDSPEIFKLKEGYFMLTPGLGKTEKMEKPAENKEEKEQFALLYDLSLVPFNNRDVESISASLNPKQNAMLNKMIEDKTLSVFEKNGKSMIQFPTELYSRLKDYTSSMKGEPQNSAKQEGSKAAQPAQKAQTNDRINDFAVFAKDEFREFQRRMDPKELKYFLVLPWFDGKVYVGARAWLISGGQKAIDILTKRKELTNDELATELKISYDAARTIAISLCNEGIIIESKKGFYSLVE